MMLVAPPHSGILFLRVSAASITDGKTRRRDDLIYTEKEVVYLNFLENLQIIHVIFQFYWRVEKASQAGRRHFASVKH